MHVEREVGQRDLCLGTGDANSANEQALFRLLMRKNMLDPGADLGFGGVAALDILRHRAPLGLPAVDAANPALDLEPSFVALAAIGRALS